jgi:hypothetical protein
MAGDFICYVLPPLAGHGIAPINLFDHVQAIPVPFKYVVAFNPVRDAHLVSHCQAPFAQEYSRIGCDGLVKRAKIRTQIDPHHQCRARSKKGGMRTASAPVTPLAPGRFSIMGPAASSAAYPSRGIAFLLVRLSASSTGDCYVCYELIGQVVQGTEQVLPTAMIRLDLIALCP